MRHFMGTFISLATPVILGPLALVMLIGVFTCQVAAAVTSRINAPIDAGDRVSLVGNTHYLIASSVDQGMIAGQTQLGHMYLILQRSAEQERALAALSERQYDVNSPDYHHWLQPREFGLAYGPSDADLAAISSWLTSVGLQVLNVGNGRISVEFTGTAAQVQRAFGVQMHRYLRNGTLQIANDRDPQIPRALSPVVAGVSGLSDFPMSFDIKSHDTAPSASTGNLPRSSAASPDFTVPDGTKEFHILAPDDFATIYNALPLRTAKPVINGAGIKIAVVGSNDVNPADIASYRSTFHLLANTPTIKLVGADPKGSALADTAELELAAAAAPGAELILVVPDGGGTAFADFLSAATYIVDQNIAPIVTANVMACELHMGTSNNLAINNLWQQGAMQGMSIFAAAGGQGSAGCASGAIAVDNTGLQVNGVASSPYVTAVGGTDFSWAWQPFQASNYWSSSNSAAGESATGYIPEMPWNTSCANPLLQAYFFIKNGAPQYPTPLDICVAYDNNQYFYPFISPAGGGGGYSHCNTLTSSGTCSTTAGYAKPAWQVGPGVPNDSKRDLPDVALFASGGFPAVPGTGTVAGGVSVPPTSLIPGSSIVICYSEKDIPAQFDTCTYTSWTNNAGFQTAGGSGLASAYWAGILALIEQKQGGARQGLINRTLYPLWQAQIKKQKTSTACDTTAVAAGNTCDFYDISTFPDLANPTTNGQPCLTSSSSDCVSTGYLTGILDGYAATAGYDQATGIGSVNIANLVNDWSSSAPSPTLSVSAAGLAFGSAAAGSTTAAQKVTLMNTGSVAVTFDTGGISLTGQTDDFSLTNGCAASLAVGASCTLTVVFKPVSTGEKSATISIASNASNSPKTVALTGTGTAGGAVPTVKLSPTTLNFAAQAAGSESTAQVVTVSNGGSGTLSLSSIALSGGQADDFVLAKGCGTSLPAGASCTLSIAFKPVSAGSKVASISIVDNAAGSPQTVALSGTGSAAGASPTLKLSVSTLVFGTQVHGTASAAKSVTLTNGGTGSLSLTAITIGGAQADDFSLSKTCGTSLAAGASCALSVTFKPVSAGGKVANISIADNASGSPQTVALSGTGT